MSLLEGNEENIIDLSDIVPLLESDEKGKKD